MSIIELDLWGGRQRFDTDTGVYTIYRPYGLGSNITVSMFGIAKIKSLGYNVNTLELFLEEYELNYNFYKELFVKKILPGNELLSTDEATQFISSIHPTNYGLSSGWARFNESGILNTMPILSKIYNQYYTITDEILYKIHSLRQSINCEDSIFVWARRTDKISENTIPSTERYLEEIYKCNTRGFIYIQTDDINVAQEFLKINDPRIVVLQILPMVDGTTNSFHTRLYSMSSDTFEAEYKMSKCEYLQTWLALTHIAAKCKYYVGYPGNLTTLIPIMRGSFDECILFHDATRLVEP